MSEKHTQGRLLVTVGYGPYAGRMILAEGRVSCIAEAMNEDAEANARRLVACWNALEGLTTPEIEEGINTSTVRLMYQKCELVTQRDELLAALEVARKLVHLGVGATNEELHQIDAAIAKVKGGAA